MAAGEAGSLRQSREQVSDPGTCATWLEDHAAWMDGFLSEEEGAAHEAHAAVCASCARYARVLDRGLQLVRDLPQIEPSAHFEQRLQHRIFHIEDEARLGRNSGRSAAGLAAAALIGVIAWSPVLWRSDVGTTLRAFGESGRYDAVAAAEPAGSLYATTSGRSTRLASRTRDETRQSWYVRPAAPEIEQTPVYHLVSNTGTYSPLIVSPPAYGRGPRAVRLMSAATQ